MTLSTPARQLDFDELEEPLRETTFVVVDLETTGARPGADAITEIGAVKIRGGEVLGEMATLIDPGCEIPPHIVELTGITSAMLVRAPRIESVLPAFLEFARGAVLIAHNARFDLAFLRAAAADCGLAWPAARSLCTVRLARRVLGRDEAPSVRLSALAALFAVETQPTHRALDDARATVEVFHRLLERVGNQGVHSYSELVDYLPAVSRAQREKRHLASSLPSAPGVYLFRGPSGEVLYVGTAVDLRRRVRQYFTGSDTRGRMKEMVALTIGVDHVVCAHGLEAAVRELRLIEAHSPPYNRRSKYPRRAWWVALSDEAFPRAVVRRTAGIDALGPFRSRANAAEVAESLSAACALRTCTGRLSARALHGAECEQRRVPRCEGLGAAPESAADYRVRAQAALALLRGADSTPLIRRREHVERLAAAERFETAARDRDGLAALARALRRMQRLRALADVDELVAARSDTQGGWHFVVLRAGRLAAAGKAVRGVAPMPVVDALLATADHVEPADEPLRGARAEELALLARWLDEGPARLVVTSDGYDEPLHGAGGWEEWCAQARNARADASEPQAKPYA